MSVCSGCSQGYESLYANSLYCSRKCKQRAKRQRRNLREGAAIGKDAAEDLIGKLFTRLMVVGYDGTRGKNSYLKCQCSCGTIKSVRRDLLLNGDQKSCGCLGQEMTAARIAGAEPRRAQERLERLLREQKRKQKQAEKAERELLLKRMLRPKVKHAGRCWWNRPIAAVMRRLHEVSQLEIAKFFNISVSHVNEIQQIAAGVESSPFDEPFYYPNKIGAPPFRALRCSCGRYQQVAAADSEIIEQQRHRIEELQIKIKESEAEISRLKTAA